MKDGDPLPLGHDPRDIRIIAEVYQHSVMILHLIAKHPDHEFRVKGMALHFALIDAIKARDKALSTKLADDLLAFGQKLRPPHD